jgi:type II secretory ATPase GspE/PulE/Tfp pilus assembly ATPase PilB-like protein
MNGVMREGSLGSILFKSQIITEADIVAALAEQQSTGCRFGEALIGLGIVTQEDIDWALAHQLDIPYVRLKRELIDPEAVALVPAAVARAHTLMPLVKVGDELSIVMADPLDTLAIAAVAGATGCRVTVSVGLVREIREMLEAVYGPAGENPLLGFVSDRFPGQVLDEINADLSGQKFLDFLLRFILQKNLSSLSLEPLGDRIAVTGRRGGMSRELGSLAVSSYPDIVRLLRRRAGMNGATDPVLEGVIPFAGMGKEFRFQVNMLRGCGGEYVTLSLFVAATFPTSVAGLGISPEKAERFRSLAAVRQGMLLFVMPAHEERCRLLDIFLDACDTAGRSVLLLGEGLGRGARRFARIPCKNEPQIVTAALEHHPDILVIDDVSPGNVFVAASRAAMRGKLVVAGLALHDLESTVSLLRNFWKRNLFIPSYLKGVVCCKGVMTLCPSCRERYVPSADELAALRLPEGSGYFAPRGCPVCDRTGYSGKRYLMDIIPFTPEFVARFEAAADGREVVAALAASGCHGIPAEGAVLLAAGEIAPGEYISSILN